MKRQVATWLCVAVALTAPAIAVSDELTRIVQKDLQALGYDPGSVDGELSTKTAIAVSQFQADNDLEVTGEITPQLAGTIKAVQKGTYQAPGAHSSSGPARAAAMTPPAAAMSQQDLQALQQSCLQEKIAAAQERQQQKRGFGRLLSAAGRVGRRFGVGNDLNEVTRDVYDVNATAEDLAGAAKDLGLTQDEVEACRNP